MAETMHNAEAPGAQQRQMGEVRAEIDALRRREGVDLKPFEVHRRAADLVWDHLTSQGRFLRRDHRTYYELAGSETAAIEVSRSDTSFCVLLDDLGLNPAEDIFNFVVEDLRIKAHRTEVPVLESEITSAKLSAPGPEFVKLSDASVDYDIPKSFLSKAAGKPPGKPGYLWSQKIDGNRFFLRDDILRVSKSRSKLRDRVSTRVRSNRS